VNAPQEPNAAASTSPQADKRFRFPRTAKLLKHSDFQRVYKSGKRHFSGLLTAFYLPRTDASQPGPRIGITVSRVMGGAVVRNRMRRRMREAIRFHLPEIAADVDVVFNPKKLVLDAEFAAIDQEVKRAFEVIQKNAASLSRSAANAKERSTAP
jgi:ribonuclease P protein component